MAGEIQLPWTVSGLTTLYAIVRNAVGQVWYPTGGAFEAYNASHYANYAIALTEQGANGYYVGDFPSAITAGVYSYAVYQSTGTADPSDCVRLRGSEANFQWSGTVPVSLVSSGVKLADAVAHGGMLGSSTATLALSRFSIVSQSSNTSAMIVTGNGTGSGAVFTSGSGATGDGVQMVSAASVSGNGLYAAGSNGDGIAATATGTGRGMHLTGGNTGGAGLKCEGTASSGANGAEFYGSANGSGMSLLGNGTGSGLLALSGAGATGDGAKFQSQATAGNGLSLIHSGSGVHDLNATTTPLQLPSNGLANITSWAVTISTVTTVTTATNLTNAPTNGDFTAAMKSSLDASTPVINVTKWAGENVIATEVPGVPMVEVRYFYGTVYDNLIDAIAAQITIDHGSGSYVRNTEPLDAEGTRNAIGLASANLDTQLAPLASFTFTITGQVDANIQYVNDVQVKGTGTSADPWNPV